MKKICCIGIVCLCLSLVVSACAKPGGGGENEASASPAAFTPDGYFVSSGLPSEPGEGTLPVIHYPYIRFDRESGTFLSSGGIAMNFAISGAFAVQDGLVTLTAEAGEPVCTLEILEGSALRLRETFPQGLGAVWWLREGDVFRFQTEPSPVSGIMAPADEALRLSKERGAVVMEDLSCTAGRESWASFTEAVGASLPASVSCAFYYTLDESRVSPEVWEAEKDLYPVLYFYALSFDGAAFTVTVRQSDKPEAESMESFRFLLHDTAAGSRNGETGVYERWFLADDETVTWKEIEAGVVSSQSDAGVRHCLVFQSFTAE